MAVKYLAVCKFYKVNNRNNMDSRQTSNILVISAFVVGVYFLRDYLGIIALAALTTILAAPLHDRITSRKGRIKQFATSLTIGGVILAVLVPLFILIGLSFYEANQIIHQVRERDAAEVQQINEVTKKAGDIADDLGVNLSREQIRSHIDDIVKKVVPGVLDFIFRTTGSVFSFFTSAIVYFMVLATLLSRKDELITIFKRLSPFDDKIDNEYLRNIKAMAISMVKGTFIIAAIVGLISAATLWVIGFPYIAFWFMLFTFMSLIPLGAGVIYVPIGIILLLTGSIWQGLLIISVQFVILNNIDNVLRPRLAPRESNLPGVLLLISTFAGVGYFGILGVVYGPIVMALIYTTVELYYRHRDTGLPLKTYRQPAG